MGEGMNPDEEEHGAVAKRGQILDSLELLNNNPPD